MMPLEALVDQQQQTGHRFRIWALPVDLARSITITSKDQRWRRLFTAPKNGPIIGSTCTPYLPWPPRQADSAP